MITKEQLTKIMFQCFYNIIELKNYFQLYKTIQTDIDNSINKVNKYPYMFSTIISSLQNSFIMETYKLFVSNEERSIKNIVGLCRKNKKHFSDNRIEEMLDKIDKLIDNNKIILDNVKKVRDKYLAHSDRQYYIKISDLFSKYKIKNDTIEFLIGESYDNIKSICSSLQSFMINDISLEIKKEWVDLINNM